MLVWPQVDLLTSMSSRSIGMIHIPLASEYAYQTEKKKNVTKNHFVKHIIY